MSYVNQCDFGCMCVSISKCVCVHKGCVGNRGWFGVLGVPYCNVLYHKDCIMYDPQPLH